MRLLAIQPDRYFHQGRPHFGGEALITKQWAEPIIEEFGPLSRVVESQFLHRRKKQPASANAWLRDVHQILRGAPQAIREIDSPADIDDVARWAAEACSKRESATQVDEFTLRHRLPTVPGEDQCKVARASDVHYWRRVLRRLVGRYRDQLMRHLGRVHKRAQIYCADTTVAWQQVRQAQNLRVLESMLAVSDHGDELSLADIHAASLANPAIRRQEILARISGMERYADEQGHRAVFVTITAPSKYHARFSKSGYLNRKYNGSTPADVNRYLGQVWARIRAALHRRGIAPYGLRVAEPHHDGTPHWHFLLFLNLKHGAELSQIFRRYAMAEDGQEPGAHKHRVKFEWIDGDKGSATGYVIKYVAKNLDGEGVGNDLFGKEAEASASRIVAWARTWGIRQFQQIGGAPVGVWREYRSVREHNRVPFGHHMPWLYADGGDFCGFMDEYLNQPVTLYKMQRLNPLTGEVTASINRYGEEKRACDYPIVGLVRGDVYMQTAFKWWEILRGPGKGGAAHAALSDDELLAVREKITLVSRDGEALHRVNGSASELRFKNPAASAADLAATGGAWTCVTNCTGPPI